MENEKIEISKKEKILALIVSISLPLVLFLLVYLVSIIFKI